MAKYLFSFLLIVVSYVHCDPHMGSSNVAKVTYSEKSICDPCDPCSPCDPCTACNPRIQPKPKNEPIASNSYRDSQKPSILVELEELSQEMATDNYLVQRACDPCDPCSPCDPCNACNPRMQTPSVNSNTGSKRYKSCGGCDPCDPCNSCNPRMQPSPAPKPVNTNNGYSRKDVCDPCNPCSPCDPCNACNPRNNNPNDCKSCQCNPCCCEICDFIPPCPPEMSAYNAPDWIDIKCGWDIYITGSFVYATASEENLEFMESQLQTNPGSPNGLTQIDDCRFSTLSYDYEPAFKVGIGFNFGCDHWGFYAEYFRYHADVGSGSFEASNTDASKQLRAQFYQDFGSFIQGFSAASEYVFSTKGITKWRLEMDTADFLLGRRYYVGTNLLFQPQFGIRAAWIDQKVDTTYTKSNPIPESAESDITIKSSSWAVGLKAALHTDWKFCGNFYIFNDTSFDILYTEYEMSLDADGIRNLEVGLRPGKAGFKRDSDYNFLRPHTSIGAGIGWGDYFCCNDWYFDLKAGYEFHIFWNQNVLPTSEPAKTDPSRLNGDLFLHGLVVTLRTDF